MFTPTREESRRFLAGAWAKYRAGQPLAGLEQHVVAIIAMHPEYHAMLEDAGRNLEREWTPDGGTTNPFLHLSLHLAVAEQIAIDQPPGILAHFERLRAARGSDHEALHAIVECLGEVIWQSQRTQSAPDATVYQACLERQR
jgi:hypothetical protein